MSISMNSTGTAHFDPRPAVVKFLEKKDRRNKFPAELYKEKVFQWLKLACTTGLVNLQVFRVEYYFVPNYTRNGNLSRTETVD